MIGNITHVLKITFCPPILPLKNERKRIMIRDVLEKTGVQKGGQTR